MPSRTSVATSAFAGTSSAVASICALAAARSSPALPTAPRTSSASDLAASAMSSAFDEPPSICACSSVTCVCVSSSSERSDNAQTSSPMLVQRLGARRRGASRRRPRRGRGAYGRSQPAVVAARGRTAAGRDAATRRAHASDRDTRRGLRSGCGGGGALRAVARPTRQRLRRPRSTGSRRGRARRRLPRPVHLAPAVHDRPRGGAVHRQPPVGRRARQHVRGQGAVRAADPACDAHRSARDHHRRPRRGARASERTSLPGRRASCSASPAS